MNIEITEKQFDFLSPELERPKNFIRRFQQGNNRFYYTVSEEGEIKLYASATTLIRDGYAEDSTPLEKWRNGLRAEGKNAEHELMYLGTRGTIMHFLLGECSQGKEIPLTNLNGFITEFAPELTTIPFYKEVLAKDTKWLNKSVLAFLQFMKDYNVRPLAIELILASDEYGVASPIDMPCIMDIEEKGFFGEVYKSGANKGEPKETKQKRTVVAVVDFKSGNFYDKHYLQLQLYKRIMKENYPELEVEALYNWSPKDWSGSPTYNLREQSDGKLDALCETIFEQGRIKHEWKTPSVSLFTETISLDSYNGSEAFKKLPLQEYLKQLHGEGSKATKK